MAEFTEFDIEKQKKKFTNILSKRNSLFKCHKFYRYGVNILEMVDKVLVTASTFLFRIDTRN